MFDVINQRYVKLEDLPYSKERQNAVALQWHPLDLHTIEVDRMPVISGYVPRAGDNRSRTYHNYPVEALVGEGLVVPLRDWNTHITSPDVFVEADSSYIWNPFVPHLNHLDLSEDLTPVQTVLASCNPTRAVLDIPAEAFETLVSLADLVLLKGKSLSGHAGKVNLAYEFGWKPLIADLKRLGKLQKYIDKRIKTLLRLHAGRQSSKGNIAKHSKQEVSNFSVSLDSGLDNKYVVHYKLTRKTTVDRWGCVEYIVPQEFVSRLDDMTPQELVDEAIKELTSSEWWRNPSGWWEVTPWSWLTDWFFDIQDVLKRYNTVELNPWRYCVMTRTVTHSVAEVTSIDSAFAGLDVDTDSLAWEGTITSRTRYVGMDNLDPLPHISGSMPTFTDRQARILASLFAIYKDVGRKVSSLASLRRL
jgi:hypothetical protein